MATEIQTGATACADCGHALLARWGVQRCLRCDKAHARTAEGKAERRAAKTAFAASVVALPTRCPDCGECIAPATAVFGVRVDGEHECRKAAALAVAS